MSDVDERRSALQAIIDDEDQPADLREVASFALENLEAREAYSQMVENTSFDSESEPDLTDPSVQEELREQVRSRRAFIDAQYIRSIQELGRKAGDDSETIARAVEEAKAQQAALNEWESGSELASSPEWREFELAGYFADRAASLAADEAANRPGRDEEMLAALQSDHDAAIDRVLAGEL